MNPDDTSIYITLGSGNEFGISGSKMFLRATRRDPSGHIRILDLGPSTRENFNRLIDTMERLKCHMKDE